MNEIRKRCTCDKENSLNIGRKQASRLVSCSLLCAFFIFIAGYFWGKKKAIELYTSSAKQEVFSDLISSSLDTVYNEENQDIAMQPLQSAPLQSEAALVCEEHECYKAQLIGFGTLNAAKQFVERLKKAGIITTIAKRTSTPSGRNASRRNVIYWYQVVTEAFSDRQNLELLVEKIKNMEKIHGVQIVRIDHDGNARQVT